MAVKETLSKYEHLIEEVGLKQNEFDAVVEKLDNIKFLDDVLQFNMISETYNRVLKNIEEFIFNKYNDMKLEIENCLSTSGGSINSSIIDRCIFNYKVIVKCVNSYKDHFK